MKPTKAKRGFLFAAACLFAITAGVYEWFLSGRLSSPPASVSIDAIITRTLGAVAAACLLPIFGYRIGNMAYLTDVKYLPEEEYAKLEGLDVLILTALRRGAHPTHESLEEALVNIERIKPKETYLIHMSHRIGLHAEVEKELPPHVHLAYDGLHVSTALSHSLLFRK